MKHAREYPGLACTFHEHREFYRYVLFHDALRKSKFDPEDIKRIQYLIDPEKKTLGSYLAENPVVVWIYTTSGLVIGSSAQNWTFDEVVRWVALLIIALVIVHVVPVFISEPKRQFEIHRFLEWYKSDFSS